MGWRRIALVLAGLNLVLIALVLVRIRPLEAKERVSPGVLRGSALELVDAQGLDDLDAPGLGPALFSHGSGVRGPQVRGSDSLVHHFTISPFHHFTIRLKPVPSRRTP
jgi:hypothetical protein